MGTDKRNSPKKKNILFHANADQPITDWLNQWEEGDREAAEKLFNVAITELEKIARAHLIRFRPKITLDTKELVNDAYLRLSHKKKTEWNSRSHFFGVTAWIMREIITDKFRLKGAIKRGEGKRDLTFEDYIAKMPGNTQFNLIYIADALEEMSKMKPEWERVVVMKYFFGFTSEETGDFLDISDRTVKRYWQQAKNWLRLYLRGMEKFDFKQNNREDPKKENHPQINEEQPPETKEDPRDES